MMAEQGLWARTGGAAVAAPPLDGDRSADLVIVGGGFTGCAAALRAAEAGLSVVLLEATEIGHGGSGRNVGLVNAGLWLPPDRIVDKMGADAGERLSRALGGAPDLVFGLIDRHGIACEPVRNGTLHLAHAPAAMTELRDRHDQGVARQIPLRLLDREEVTARLGTDAFHGALLDPRAGTIQPLAYVRGLARAAQGAGAALFSGTPVRGIARRGEDWRVQAAGGTVTAPALILATNAYRHDLAFGAGTQAPPALTPVGFFQIATAPVDAPEILPGGEGTWDTHTVMTSLRRDAAGRVILGGMGRLDMPHAPLHRDWARRRLARIYPTLKDAPIETAWWGRIGMSADKIPSIVRLGPQGYAPQGYSGRGIGPGTLLGQALAEAVIDGTEAALPLAPVEARRSARALAEGIFIETGAAFYHAGAARF